MHSGRYREMLAVPGRKATITYGLVINMIWIQLICITMFFSFFHHPAIFLHNLFPVPFLF